MHDRALLGGRDCTPAWAIEPADSVAHALQQIEAKRYSLARNYLDTVVADTRLNGVQRSRAYYYRGYAFLADGLYVSAAQDFERALELDPGNSTVLAELGRLYANGNGVAKNSATAFKLFQKAARAGNDTARLYVGYALLSGIGTATDVPKARYWLREAGRCRARRRAGATRSQLSRTVRRSARSRSRARVVSAGGRQGLGGSVDRARLRVPRRARPVHPICNARHSTSVRRRKRGSPAAQTALGFMSIADRHYDCRATVVRARGGRSVSRKRSPDSGVCIRRGSASPRAAHGRSKTT